MTVRDAQNPAATDWKKVLQRVDEYRWLLPQDYKCTGCGYLSGEAAAECPARGKPIGGSAWSG